MVDLIEFPTNKVAPDSHPQPGDQYEAYGLAHKIQPFMLTLVFPDWSMTALPYLKLERMEFKPLGEDGECVITLLFGGSLGGDEVVITGRNLYDLYFDIGDHHVHWLWELPKDRAAAAPDAPVVHAIDIREFKQKPQTPATAAHP